MGGPNKSGHDGGGLRLAHHQDLEGAGLGGRALAGGDGQIVLSRRQVEAPGPGVDGAGARADLCGHGLDDGVVGRGRRARSRSAGRRARSGCRPGCGRDRRSPRRGSRRSSSWRSPCRWPRRGCWLAVRRRPRSADGRRHRPGRSAACSRPWRSGRDGALAQVDDRDLAGALDVDEEQALAVDGGPNSSESPTLIVPTPFGLRIDQGERCPASPLMTITRPLAGRRSRRRRRRRRYARLDQRAVRGA